MDAGPQRDDLVDRLIGQGTLGDPRVIAAMRKVPREQFLPSEHRDEAYADKPLRIGHGQTISAPHMVAIMCERLLLEPGHRVFEVGTGSGYHAAVVDEIVGREGSVTTIEYVADLAETARRRLAAAGHPGVRVLVGDGARGAPEHGPYDRIYLACAGPSFPPPLLRQLKPEGFILGPLGGEVSRLVRAHRSGGAWVDEDLGACAFVPLLGEYGAT